MGKTIVHERPWITISMNENVAKVLSDPHRLKILDFLYHKNLSTKDLFDLLKRAKFNIAMTILRHSHNYTEKKQFDRCL